MMRSVDEIVDELKELLPPDKRPFVDKLQRCITETERERCAKIAESFSHTDLTLIEGGAAEMLLNEIEASIAAKIRKEK